MKVNIKGLAFVGFAAAIFAASAHADTAEEIAAKKKTVTSQYYAEQTYQTLANKLAQGEGTTAKLGLNDTDVDDTHYPTAKAVAQALASNASATTYSEGAGIDITNNVITNEGVRSIATGGADDANGTISVNTNGTTAAVAVKGLQDTAFTQTTTNTDLSETAKIPTAGTVKSYADTKVAANAEITGATKTKITYDAKGLVTGGADLAASDLPAITDNAASDAGKILVVGNDGKITVGSTSASGTYQIVADKVASIDDSANETNNVNTTKYASTAAVTGWAQKKIPAGTAGKLVTYSGTAGTVSEATLGTATLTVSQNGVSAGTFGANATADGSISIAAPDWDVTTDTAADYIKNKPTISNAGSEISGATSADTKELPTVYAVKDYVTSYVPTIPAPTGCTDAAPCALVATSSGAAWVSMAQPTAQ